jgi:hypothetical protein
VIEKDITGIYVEILCLEDSRPTAQFLVQKFEEHEEIDDILDRDNHIESLLVYSAEHWPRHLRYLDWRHRLGLVMEKTKRDCERTKRDCERHKRGRSSP